MLTVGVDGSALGNPGPAGWAWYIDDSNWAAGGWPKATNNRGELSAIIEILKATEHTHHDLTILADSQYAINAVTKWLPGWKKRGWKKADGKPVVNKDLMVQLDELMTAAQAADRNITFQWVRGHAGHPLNEAADSRANAAATAFQAGQTPDSGPGLNISDDTLHEDGTAEFSPQESKAPVRVTVHTPLDKSLADEIVQRAQQRGVTPHEELARLIEAGMGTVYNTDQ